MRPEARDVRREGTIRGQLLEIMGHTLTIGQEITILAVFALAMGLFSLANILVGYDLSRGETRYAWIVAVGVAAQVVLLALDLPDNAHRLASHRDVEVIRRRPRNGQLDHHVIIGYVKVRGRPALGWA